MCSVRAGVRSGKKESLTLLAFITGNSGLEPLFEDLFAQIHIWNDLYTKRHQNIQDDVKLAQLVRALDCQSRGRQFDSGKTPKEPKTQIYTDLSYIDPPARVLNYCFK